MAYHPSRSYFESIEQYLARRYAPVEAPTYPAFRKENNERVNNPVTMRHRMPPISVLKRKRFLGECSILAAHENDAY